MGGGGMAAVLALALSPAAPAGVQVTANGDRVDVIAAQAPVSEVLDGLARNTRMKVVYEGPAPRTLVTVELRGRTPAQAVLGVLEGLGLNYALVLDASGNQVETLMITGPGSARLAAAASPRPASSARTRQAPHASPENPMVESAEPLPEPEPMPEEAVVPEAPDPPSPSPGPNRGPGPGPGPGPNPVPSPGPGASPPPDR